jgi:hypothetical protein
MRLAPSALPGGIMLEKTKTKARPPTDDVTIWTPYEAETAPAGRVTIIVDGITPLMTHNPQSMGTPKGATKGSRIPEPEVEAEAGTYRLDDGTCAITGSAFRESLLEAAGAFKGPKRTSMKGLLFHIAVEQELIALKLRDGTLIKNFEIDRRRAIVQGQGIIRCRPKFREWSAEFTINFDTLLVRDPKLIIEILNDAGNRIGCGDYRPGTSKRGHGTFGRFQVRCYRVE